jgi:hypothetical protein
VKKGFGFVFVLLALAVLTITYSARVHAKADDQAEITAVEQRVIEGFKGKDVDKIMSAYVPDDSLFVFDVVPPREYVGAKAYRKDWEDLFAQFPGPVEADLSELKVVAPANADPPITKDQNARGRSDRRPPMRNMSCS